jgi:CrcB protein
MAWSADARHLARDFLFEVLVRTFWAVAAGAAAGGVSRYYLSLAIHNRVGAAFPWGTLLVNVTGSLLLGFLMRYAIATPSVSAELRLLLTTGFCGGYTTFSTFAQETLDLLEEGDARVAIASVVANVALGTLAVLLGVKLGRLV